jgi:predicted MFS family arabinose efflux permease
LTGCSRGWPCRHPRLAKVKRTFLLQSSSSVPLIAAGTGLVAATYGLIRLAYGLLLPEVQDDLALGVAASGAISSGASVVYCAGALLGFLVAARHPRALVVASAFSAGIGAAGMAASPSAGTFAVAAIVSSGGAGLASPALVAVLQRNRSTTRSPRAQSIVNAGTGPGLVAAGLLALALLPNWRLAWLVAAVFTAAVGCLVIVLDRRDADAAPARQSLPPASWFTAHRRLLAAALLMGCGSAAVWNYGRTLLVESGADEVVSVAAWIALGAGGTAVIATARWLEERGPRTAWILTVGALAVATAVLAAVPTSTPLAWTACAAFGWGYTAATGALIGWTAQLDPVRAPSGTAMLFITLILGQALGATAVGMLIPAVGYPLAFLGAALTAAAAAAVARASRESKASGP